MVLVELVVLEVVVEVVVVVELVDVVAGSVAAGGTDVLSLIVEEGAADDATVVDATPSADWIFSLHAAVAARVMSTSRAVAARFIPRSRPTGRRRAGRPPPGPAPSIRRGGR